MNLKTFITEQSQISGIAGILITNVILILPMIWLARRWIMPFGSYTILLSLPMILMGVLDGKFNMALIGIITGIIADLIYKIWQLSPTAANKNHTIFTIVPFFLFSLYFLILQLTTSGILRKPVFWGESIVLTMLSGLTLSTFAFSRSPKDADSMGCMSRLRSDNACQKSEFVLQSHYQYTIA